MFFLSALEERFADIFFLVDGGITSSQFQQVRTVLTRLTNQLNFEASAYRLGLAYYSQQVQEEFLLNKHQTKAQVQAAIKTLRPFRRSATDPRNLGAALEYASTRFFTGDAGGRADQGYRQFLVVVSGKDSDDSVYKQARLIQSEGVTVVGMSLGASLMELQVIATGPHVYQFNMAVTPLLRKIFETEEPETFQTGGKETLISSICNEFT